MGVFVIDSFDIVVLFFEINEELIGSFWRWLLILVL
jgi:hypothetical protein